MAKTVKMKRDVDWLQSVAIYFSVWLNKLHPVWCLESAQAHYRIPVVSHSGALKACTEQFIL